MYKKKHYANPNVIQTMCDDAELVLYEQYRRHMTSCCFATPATSCRCHPLRPMFDEWVDSLSNDGPGCIDLGLDDFLVDDESTRKLIHILGLSEREIEDFSRTYPKNKLSDARVVFSEEKTWEDNKSWYRREIMVSSRPVQFRRQLSCFTYCHHKTRCGSPNESPGLMPQVDA